MADRQQRMSTQSVSWEVEETDDPISGRITQVDESTIKLPGGTTIEYGAVSLRGYYPDDPEKANQDSHVCIADFNAAGKTLGDYTSEIGKFDKARKEVEKRSVADVRFTLFTVACGPVKTKLASRAEEMSEKMRMSVKQMFDLEIGLH